MASNIYGALIFMFVNILFFLLVYVILVKIFGQKTRNPQQRRMYVGSRARSSLGQTEPTIFVSPSNYPPPPKYECMAPPSYEEVVGVHYPNYQPQPITQPISAALAQSVQSSSSSRSNETSTVPETVVTVTVPERGITVTASS